jgi:protein-S-isoprenylcysteine O-methyltransferase Ste14
MRQVGRASVGCLTIEKGETYLGGLNMNSTLLVAFLLCLASYIFHTVTHFFEYKRYKFAKSKTLQTMLTIIIFIGYFGWGFMIFLDPLRMNISNYIAIFLGLLIGLAGLLMFILSTKAKKGFYELDRLVIKGIYSKIRNPMYVGIILIHIGFPLASKSLLTLISAIIWIPLIFTWKYWEEQDLERKFGKEYSEYKKRTLF